jgi:ABC-type transport system involved in multi-copper enzyme maturation permease subunit
MRGMRLARPQLNPIIVREVRTRMRGVRPYLILTGFLLLLAAGGYGIYQLMLQQSRFGTTLLSAQVGQALFRGLAFLEILLVVFLAPSMTSGAISGEREQLTYDMLLATPLRPAQILWGKLIAALSYLFLLIFASVPMFSVVLVFGGVELSALLKALALLMATTICFGALGLTCSAFARRTARATTVAYILVLLLIGLPVLVASVWSQFSSPQGQLPPPALVYLNPFSALLSIMTIVPMNDPTMSSIGYGDPFGGLPLLSLLAPGVVFYGPNGAVVVPIYRATLLFFPLLTLLLCWLSSHMVLPNRRWRPRWGDLLFLALTAALMTTIALTQWWWRVAPPQL